MSAIIASAAIGAVGAGYKVAQGISQNSAANKLQRGLVRPMYKIQDQYYQNQGLAENAAQNGLGANALNYYGDQANRGLASGISGVLQGGGDVNSINGLYDKFNQGNRAISAEDARLKTDNIRYLVDRNKDLAGQETQQWALNKYEPYKDTATAITGLRNSGSQNISGGISEAGSVLSTLAGNIKADKAATPGPDPDKIINNPTITDINKTSNTLGTANPFSTNGGMIVPGSAIDPNVVNGIATNNVLKQYQNSPYYAGLSAYLNQSVA